MSDMSNRVFAYVGLNRPYRFERAIPVLVALVLAHRHHPGRRLAGRDRRAAGERPARPLLPLSAGAPRLGDRTGALAAAGGGPARPGGDRLRMGRRVLRPGPRRLRHLVPAAAGHGRAAALPMACAAAGRADPLAPAYQRHRPCDQPHLRGYARKGSRAGQPGRTHRRGDLRRLDDLRHRRGRGRYLERSAGRGAGGGSLLRRQSRRARLHHGRAPDPDGVLPDQVRQAAALRDLLCRLERSAQRPHRRPRSGLCRLPPAEPGRFAQDPAGRRLRTSRSRRCSPW